MMEKKLQTLDVEKIDVNDETFCYSTAEPGAALVTSIRQVGMIHPVLVQQSGEKYRIVTGFKRIKAVMRLGQKTCPVFVINDSENSLDLFMLAIHDNLSVKSLNPIELAKIVHTLQSSFNIDNDTIVKTYLPQLGYGRNPRVLQLYSGLHRLGDAWQEALIKDQVPIDFAQEMLKQPSDIQDKMWQLIADCRLGKNRQREFFALLSDVARLLNMELAHLLEASAVQEIQRDKKLTPSQKTERLKSWLWEKRYPRYSHVQEEFERLLHAAHLPPHCTIQPPPYFEGDTFSTGFSFTSEEEFERHLSALQKAFETGLIRNMLEQT